MAVIDRIYRIDRIFQEIRQHQVSTINDARSAYRTQRDAALAFTRLIGWVSLPPKRVVNLRNLRIKLLYLKSR